MNVVPGDPTSHPKSASAGETPAATASDDATDATLWAGGEDGLLVAVSLQDAALDFTAQDGMGIDGRIDPATDAGAYDGHVPLVVDDQMLHSIDAALDVLMVSPELFDAPQVDADAGGDAASS